MMSPEIDSQSSQYSSNETLTENVSSSNENETSSNDERGDPNNNEKGRPNRKVSVEHTDYIVKERITRKDPPKPAYNPMQFVQMKPCNLYQSAQEQLKKAEQVRKAKEVHRDEGEDWQSNLDNWKSSRRKRVEHIIEKVVEVKKLEYEEHDRNRRKSKTFSEIMEERGSRRKLSTIPLYNDEDDNDLSDLGLGSGNNNNSDFSDNKLLENVSDSSEAENNNKQDDISNNNNNNNNKNSNYSADQPKSNGLNSTALIKNVIHKTTADKSRISSTMTADLSHKSNFQITSTIMEENNYTYDSAIEDYKARVSKTIKTRVYGENDDRESAAAKLDLPKVDISKRRELFEKENSTSNGINNNKVALDTEIISIKDRISSLKNNLQQQTTTATNNGNSKIDLQTTTKLKDRLSSLQQSSISVEKPQDSDVIGKIELENRPMEKPAGLVNIEDNESLDTDQEDSGIHTTDVSCSVSQSDEQQEPQIEEYHAPIEQNLIVDNEPNEQIDEESVIEEALDMAFQAIDQEVNGETINDFLAEPIYENVEEANSNESMNVSEPVEVEEITIVHKKEAYYQQPKQEEPHYEVPKNPRPVPLYENVDAMFSPQPIVLDNRELVDSDGVDDGSEMVFPIDQSKYLKMEPPKEKPPPPPEDLEPNHPVVHQTITTMNTTIDEKIVDQNFKRINSTKRIKKEIRNKRSSFLGIDGSEFDDFSLELSVAPPPNMAALLQEEKRLEKQLYERVGLYENSDNGESRDSGLSDNHSRQSSVPSTTSSTDEQNGSGILCSELRSGGGLTSYTVNHIDDDDSKIKSLEHQIREQENYCNSRQSHHNQSFFDDDQSEEVLRVERELLQLEKEELKRQRENLILRKNYARREFDEGVKMLMTNTNSSSTSNLSTTSNNRISMPDNNNHDDFNNFYENLPNSLNHNNNNSNNVYNYRKSMPNLQNIQEPYSNNYYHSQSQSSQSQTQQQQQQSQFIPSYPEPTPVIPKSYQHSHTNNHYNNMSRHSLLTISAVPKPKFTNDWVHYRKSEPVKQSLNSHWLIQEAEQRRIDQMNANKTMNNNNRNSINGGSKKPLPDSIIQTLTQRAQNMGYSDKKSSRQFDNRSSSMDPLLMLAPKTPSAIPMTNNSLVHNPLTSPFNQSLTQIVEAPTSQMLLPIPQPQQQLPQPDKLLSVSSKKKCSYCSKELKTGAAMIIENLGLFYHIDCFRCSVCHMLMADSTGNDLNGTDVRVRNNQLHCQNCFSNEDGIKFSCV